MQVSAGFVWGGRLAAARAVKDEVSQKDSL